jgi:hypothetical protein
MTGTCPFTTNLRLSTWISETGRDMDSWEFRRSSVDKESLMLRNYVFTRFVLLLLEIGQALPAHAADSCQPVFDALQKLLTTPSHSYTTSTVAKAVHPERPRRAWFRPRNTSAQMESGWILVLPRRKSWSKKEKTRRTESPVANWCVASLSMARVPRFITCKERPKTSRKIRRYGYLRLDACPCERSRT